MLQGGGKPVEAWWRGEDYLPDDVIGGRAPPRIRGIHGIEGGSRGDGEDNGKRVERDRDHGKLCGTGANCNGDVLRREDGGGGAEGGG